MLCVKIKHIMTFTESFLNELKQEAVTTRKMLERVPADLFHWQPHQKSMTLKQLATHVAELPSWVKLVLNTNELDLANKHIYTCLLLHNILFVCV